MRLGAATAIVLGVVGILGLWLPPVLVAMMCGAALLREHRRDAAVVEAIDAFWRCFGGIHRETKRGAAAAAATGEDVQMGGGGATATIDEAQYIFMHVRIQKARA